MTDFSFAFLLTASLAGLLTILSPCILPLLPLIVSGATDRRSWLRPVLVIASLTASIFAFSLLLKASTTLVDVPDQVWRIGAGVGLLLLAAFRLWPNFWEGFSRRLGFKKQSQKLLATGLSRSGWTGPVLIGLSLGPVFSSCSPAYFAIIGVILPANFSAGLVYLGAYVIALGLVMTAIALFGSVFVRRIACLSDPRGWFQRLSMIFIIVFAVLILTGTNKDIEAWFVERGIYGPVITIESVPNSE